MTALTERPADAMRRAAASPSVTALLYVDGLDDDLVTTLDALLAGVRRPEHLVVLDASGPGTAGDLAREAVGHGVAADVHRVEPGTAPRTAYDLTAGPSAEVPLPEDTTHVWLLASGQRPGTEALHALTEATRRSPSVGVAGPKIVEPADPTRLRSVGIGATRSGRVLSTPRPGEPDMGQYDGRADVLAVPAAGVLVERPLWERLGGFGPAFADLGADLDLSWRAHLAGRRVVTVPHARLAAPAGRLGDSQADTGPRRRSARRVALARCAWWTAPLLTAWVVVASLVAALVLLLAKRPRAAWTELADIGAVLDPWRPVAGRWHGRGTRTVSRRDLASLFVAPSDVARYVGDLFHHAIGTDVVAPEVRTDPTAPDDDPTADIGSLGGRLVRSPLTWVALAALVATGAAWRGVSAPLAAARGGLQGGELVGSSIGASGLFHTWWDGWSGSGLGTGALGSPASALLAVPAWLLAHFPLLGVTSPGGSAVAVTAVLALPLAAVSAYLAGRVVTRSRWPRAVVALGWAGTACASAATTEGRLGALVALVLLPLVAAGTTRLLRRAGTTAAAAGTGIAAAVLGAFAPALLVLLLAVLLVGVVLARGAARLRALLALVLPVALLGPWAVALAGDPVRLLGGPGLLAYGRTPPELLHLAALDPGGTPLPWYAALPVAAVALLGLVRGRRRALPSLALGLVAVVGLAATLLAPRLRLGSVPVGMPGAGAPVTPWWGVPMLVTLLALLALVLLGLSDLPMTRRRGGWTALLRWPIAAAVLLTAAGGLALHGARPVEGLRAWADPRPAVAVDQADGTLANRSLLLQPEGSAMGYRLVAREAPTLARDLPTDDAEGAEQTAATVRALVDGTGEDTVHGRLLALGVGFVGVSTSAGEALAQRLDATSGLVRMGSREGFAYWRVQPPAGAATATAVGTPRLSLVAGGRTTPVDVTGEHGATSADVTVRRAATLVVAQPAEWSSRATVRADDRVLTARTGTGIPRYSVPAGTRHLDVSVDPAQPWWRYGQLLLLVAAVYLAVPTGRRNGRDR